MDPLMLRFILGFAINVFVGTVAFMREMIDDKAFFMGILLFTMLYAFLDWQGYIVVVAFFAITGAAIDLENRDKANKGAFELYKAKKPLTRVLGRSLAGVIFASLFFFTNRVDFKLAFVACYAEAIFDTVSTKLGKILKDKAWLITTFESVPHGTPGGVSLPGTMLGLIAAVFISVVGALTGLVYIHELSIILISVLIGSTVDSLLNAYSYKKKHISNEFINFFSSMMAGLVCVWIYWILTGIYGMKL